MLRRYPFAKLVYMNDKKRIRQPLSISFPPEVIDLLERHGEYGYDTRSQMVCAAVRKLAGEFSGAQAESMNRAEQETLIKESVGAHLELFFDTRLSAMFASEKEGIKAEIEMSLRDTLSYMIDERLRELGLLRLPEDEERPVRENWPT